MRGQALQGESPQDEPNTLPKRPLLPSSTLSLAAFRTPINEKIAEIFLLLIWGYALFLSVINNSPEFQGYRFVGESCRKRGQRLLC